MEDWIDRLAVELGEGTVTPAELGQILKLARDVAHGVERKLAPVSTYLAGVAVGRRIAHGAERDAALGDVMAAVGPLVPEPGPES